MTAPAFRAREAAPWSRDAAATPLLAWTSPQREALADAVGRALAGWRLAWGLAADASAPACEGAESGTVVGREWQALAEGAWLGALAEAGDPVAALLFGEAGASSPVARDLRDACARDLRQCLAAALRMPQADVAAAPPPGLGLPWSGAVQVRLPGLPGHALLVGPAAMQTWCREAGLLVDRTRTAAPPEPLCPAAEALGARPLPLNVELSGCELALGHLQALQVGDVVRLPHALDAPVRLTDAHGETVFQAFLVASAGRKAVELAKPQAH